MNDKEIKMLELAKQFFEIPDGYCYKNNPHFLQIFEMGCEAGLKFKPKAGEVEKLRNALEDAVNGLQWKIDNEDYDNADVEKLEEWKLILQDNCLSKEKEEKEEIKKPIRCKTVDEIIKEEFGIRIGAEALTPMDISECRIVAERYAEQFQYFSHELGKKEVACEHLEKRKIFENCECINCGQLFIQ